MVRIQYQAGMNSKKNVMVTNKFIVKLVQMMKKYPEIIGWNKDGSELQIHNVQLFVSQVHPLYFTSSNYKSFLRQLNMYSFNKVCKRKNSISFSHPTFKQGQEHLFQTIKRRRAPAPKTPDPNPITISDSPDHTSKQSQTQNQNIPALIEDQIKQSLKQVKEALRGARKQAMLQLERRIQRLLGVHREKASEEKGEDTPQLHEYLSICKMEEMAEQFRDKCIQEGYFQSQIFNHTVR